MKNRELIKRASATTLPVFFLSLLSCSSDEQTQYVAGTSDSNTAFELPQAMKRATFPSNGSVSAYITIDPGSGGTRKTMSIGASTASFNGTVSAGQHEFLFEMFYDSPSVSETVPLVTASKSVTVASSGTTAIGFTEKDYTYLNSDASSIDIYTNVREIEKGSDPFDSDSIPNDLDDNYEDNDTFETAYDVSGLEGISLDSSSTMGQGFLVARQGILDAFDIYKLIPPSGISTLNMQFSRSNDMTYGVIYYTDASSNLVVADTIDEIDSGTFRSTFNNPPATEYTIAFFTDEDGDFVGTPDDYVDGGYAFQWWSTQ